MASIFGFSIKNIKTFRGREWDGCQGDICYHGKKVGWYNDSGDGGCVDIEFDGSFDERKRYTELLERAKDKYFDRFPLTGQFAHLPPSVDILMGALVDLTFDERMYKRCAKKGRRYVVTFAAGCVSKVASSETDKVFDMVEAMENDGSGNVTDVRKYSSLKDFEIK